MLGKCLKNGFKRLKKKMANSLRLRKRTRDLDLDAKGMRFEKQLETKTFADRKQLLSFVRKYSQLKHFQWNSNLKIFVSKKSWKPFFIDDIVFPDFKTEFNLQSEDIYDLNDFFRNEFLGFGSNRYTTDLEIGTIVDKELDSIEQKLNEEPKEVIVLRPNNKLYLEMRPTTEELEELKERQQLFKESANVCYDLVSKIEMFCDLDLA